MVMTAIRPVASPPYKLAPVRAAAAAVAHRELLLM